MAKITLLTRLKKVFGITTGTVPGTDTPTLVPGEVDRKTGTLKKVKFPDEALELLKYWLDDTYDNSETLKNRFDRYKALEFAYYNNSIVSKAVNLYADETIQESNQAEPIDVDAPSKKVTRYIKELFETLNINHDNLKDVAFNLALYGDKFWAMPSDGEDGYVESTPIDVYAVNDRLEFNAAEEAKKQTKKHAYGDFISNNTRLQALDKLLTKATDDISKFFKTYLFGFQLSKDLFLPPWNVAHFRVFSTQSEFAPFGRPLLINALAPFRQLQSVKNLMALARATVFPTKIFQVKTDEGMDPYSKWEVVNQAREQYTNLGNSATGKEQFTLDSEVWLPEGLISFDSQESRLNLDQIADVEMFRDDLIMATDIPKGYLIVDRSTFGTSSQALLAQHKPFARKVYHLQSCILKEIAQIVRLHFVMTGDYDYDTPFTLSMAFPSVEESSDRLRIKSDTLRLAKDVIDNIGQAVGLDRDEALPLDIVKDIFSRFSFLDGEDVEMWINQVIDVRAATDSQLEETKRERVSPELITETYFQTIKSTKLHEGVIGQKHIYTSYNIDPMQQIYIDLFAKNKEKDLKG